MDYEDIKERFDKQDKMQLEIRDLITSHIAEEAVLKPALEDLVALWKGSKVLSGVLATLCAAGAIVWNVYVWSKDHIK